MSSRLGVDGRDARPPAVVGSAGTESVVSMVAWVVMVAGVGLALLLPEVVRIIIAALRVAEIAIPAAAVRGRAWRPSAAGRTLSRGCSLPWGTGGPR